MLLATALVFAEAGQPVVISVGTIALARQIEAEACRFAWGKLRIGRRLAMRSFASPGRVRGQAGRLAAKGAGEEVLR